MNPDHDTLFIGACQVPCRLQRWQIILSADKIDAPKVALEFVADRRRGILRFAVH